MIKYKRPAVTYSIRHLCWVLVELTYVLRENPGPRDENVENLRNTILMLRAEGVAKLKRGLISIFVSLSLNT